MDVYATGDILSPHPEKPGLWKIIGRVDDQIMHSTGEKVNSTAKQLRVHANCFILAETNPGPLGAYYSAYRSKHIT